MKKILVWGVPVIFLLFGLLIILYAQFQSSTPATIVEKGNIIYRPADTKGRSRREAKYTLELLVEYSENNTAKVTYITTHENDIPNIGDQINIAHGLTGMVLHPNRNLIALGRTSICLGGLYLVIALGVVLTLKRKQYDS